MLFFFTYGLQKTPIDIGDFLVKCPSCETDQWAEVMVCSVYSHVYYIPLFPNDKEAMVVCKKCGLRRHGVSFNAKLVSNYQEVKHLYRHKWFTYIGAAVIALPFVLWVILAVLG